MATTAPPLPFDDRPLMTVGALAFGTGIPLLTGLYDGLPAHDARLVLGWALFVALAFAIWGGNRWLLFKQREHFDWFANPWRKLAMLVTANVVYTAPLTAAGIGAWYLLAGLPVSREAITVVTLTNVICVVFVTHAYETVFLIRERESDLMRVERLERRRAEAELASLKAQVDPHFLFNSLNTLGHLITRDAARGRAFCDGLAEVYRYVLASRERDLVPLADELAFARTWERLLALRFGAGVALHVEPALEAAARDPHRQVPPLALQTLLENAVKHNRLGDDAPLVVTMGMDADDGCVRVDNLVAPRLGSVASPGVGLANLDERCRLLTGRGLAIERGNAFTVRVPCVREAA